MGSHPDDLKHWAHPVLCDLAEEHKEDAKKIVQFKRKDSSLSLRGAASYFGSWIMGAAESEVDN